MNSALRKIARRKKRLDTSATRALRDKSQVPKATHEHCGDTCKKQRADLEAGKVVHTAKTTEDGNGA